MREITIRRIWAGVLIVVVLLAIAFTVSQLAGCTFTETRTVSKLDGAETTKSVALAVLGGDVTESRSSEQVRARSASHEPSATTVLMRPVVMAGLAFIIIGGLSLIARIKVPIIPIGASIGLIGLGIGLILLGSFVAAIGPFGWWIIAGAAIVAAVMWGPGLIANIRGNGNNGHSEEHE
jgi:hypothetical protein